MEVLREFFPLAKRDSATVIEPAESAEAFWPKWILATTGRQTNNPPMAKVVEFAEAYAGHLRQQLQAAQHQYERIWKERDAWQARAEKAEAELASLKAAREGLIPLVSAATKAVKAFADFHRNSDEYDGLRDAVSELRNAVKACPLSPAPAKTAEGPAAKEGK